MTRAGFSLKSWLTYIAKAGLLAAIYYGAARLGLRYASIGQSISLVWPPTGIAFAAMMLLGYRYWPGVALGAFLANAATPIPLAAAAGIAAGNTLEAVLAAGLLRRAASSRPQLEDLKTVRAFLLLAAPAATFVSAALGVTSLWINGVIAAPAVPLAFVVWWVGDLVGAIVVAPAFLSWTLGPPLQKGSRRFVEIAALFIGTVATAELVRSQFQNTTILRQIEYPYLLFPFVVWAALRFGVRGASLMTLTVSAVTVWHTLQGTRPFVGATPVATLFAVSFYLAVVAGTGLVLATTVHRERKRATQSLEESEARLRLALNAARMGSWFWSVERNTLTWDAQLRQLYGLRPEENVASYEAFLHRVHPDDREFVAQSVRKTLQEGGDLDYEFRVLLPNGEVRWIADQGEVGRDEDGRPAYLAGVCMDITDRKAAEERLRQAHRMESVGRLAGGVAHETNNQMSVVMGAVNFILRRDDVPQAVRSDVEYIEKAAERTAAVTAQLLAFSRRQILKPEVLDVNSVVHGWESVLRRAMGEDCAVHFRLGQDIGPVRADPGQLEQVLLNLALNARDAMPRGGTLTIETFVTELTQSYAKLRPGITIHPGRYAVLAVSDTGHGMDAATLGHVFEPFFSTKGVGRGTGLGLSTVYGIVKQSDGYVWAYSEPGAGTTFKIYLPSSNEALGVADVAIRDTPRAAGETVLVVEDEAPVRSVVERILREAGYRVLVAPDGNAALDLLVGYTGKVDLVLTDVVMPGISGRELGSRVAQLWPDTPVLFTSGYTDGEIARRGLLDAGASFLQKPFTPEALIHAVQQRMSVARSAS